MKHIVNVADDYGFSEGVSRGCIRSYKQGMLTELSLMMSSPGTEHGIRMARDNDVHGLGIHLTLNDIVGTGNYMRTADYIEMLENKSAKELSAKVIDEIKLFEDLVGEAPTHINGHQNCYAHPKIIDTIIEYALEKGIYVRQTKTFAGTNPGAGTDITQKLLDAGVKTTDYIFEHIQGGLESAREGFLEDLDSVEKGVVELYWHPAFIDDVLNKYTSLLEERERDVNLLTDLSFIKEIEGKGFSFKNFTEL